MNTAQPALFRGARGAALELRVSLKEPHQVCCSIPLPVTEVNSTYPGVSAPVAAGMRRLPLLHFSYPTCELPRRIRIHPFDLALMLLPCQWIVAEGQSWPNPC